MDTPILAGKLEFARAPSAATTMADRKEVFRNAGAQASAAAEDFTGVEGEDFMAVTDVADRSFVGYIGSLMIIKRREGICSERG